MNVERVLRGITTGDYDAPTARHLLRGQQMPNDQARWIKEGSWASHGGYPIGEEGLRRAALDALADVPPVERCESCGQPLPRIAGSVSGAGDET